jgi:tocopherol O-methyltransferase
VSCNRITISEKQRPHALKFIKKHKVEKLVTVDIKDMCNTGYHSGSFTKICGLESVCQTENKFEFLKEAYRLLKPGDAYALLMTFFIQKK